MSFENMMNELCDPAVPVTDKSARIAAVRDEEITAEMLAACARWLLDHAVPLSLDDAAIDVCGTGGSGAKTFNVSTAAAFVLAAGGAKVVKHGNRAISSQSGSSDVLAALGVPVCTDSAGAEKCFTGNNLCFVFAPAFHPVLKHVAEARRALGRPSFFNLLGPLCNPARTKRQVIGVFNARYVRAVAEAARLLGKTEVMTIRSHDGLDEISTAAPAHLCHLKDGKISETDISPEKIFPLDSLRGGTAEVNAKIIVDVFGGAGGGAEEIVCRNAGAGFVVAGIEKDLKEGGARAREILRSGRALKKLEALRGVS